MKGTWTRWGLAGVLLLLAGACGGGEEAAPSARAPEHATGEAAAGDGWVENEAPAIEWVRLEPETPGAGAGVTARVRANDPDGDPVELAYVWRLDGRLVPGASGPELSLGSARKGDELSVTVTAADEWDESAPVTVTTRIGNTPPILQNVVFDPLGTIHRGTRVTARAVAWDPDADALEFEHRWWVNGSELSTTSDTLDTSRLRRGDEVVVSVVASDGESRSNPIRSQPIPVENSPPRIVSTPRNEGGEGEYRYAVKAEDPDGDRRLRFRLEQGPAGMTIDPITGELAWQPPADAAGDHTVEVAVDDLQGGVESQIFTVVIEEGGPETAAPAAAAQAGR